MKVILLALVLALSSKGHLMAQSHSKAGSPYKPAAVFQGDTAAYLEYNYTIRAAQYVGRTVGEILEELEFPVLYIVNAIFQPGPPSTTVIALSLSVGQPSKNSHPLKDYYIYIRFENSFVLDELTKVSGRNIFSKKRIVFTKTINNFIKDLKVASVSSNEFYIKDPEILEKARQRQEEAARMGEEALKELERKRRSQ